MLDARRVRRPTLWRLPFISCLVVLAFALPALGLVLTAGKGPSPVIAPLGGDTSQWSTTAWTPTYTDGDVPIKNVSNRPATVSLLNAKAKDVRVVSVYLTVWATKPTSPDATMFDVGDGFGLPTNGTRLARGVLGWDNRLKLPATIPPGNTDWQVVWGLRTGTAGGYIHGATLKISRGQTPGRSTATCGCT